MTRPLEDTVATDQEQAEAAVEQTLSEVGRLDVLELLVRAAEQSW